MKILILYDHSGPKYHRLLLPCFYMAGIDLEIKQRLEEKDLEGVNILFFNRIISGITILQLLKWRDKYGFKMIVDFDDHWTLGKDHYLYQDYKNLQLSEVMEEFIKLADCVTVTHERLFNEVWPLNKQCYILPNAIPKLDQFKINKVPDPLTRLFWAGGITHKNDLNLLRRPLQLIRRDRCKFVLGGYVKENKEWYEMAKTFTTDSSFNTEVLEALPVVGYYGMYGLCDIALIPLIDTPFNSHKSNLKILEAANIAAPVIVSRVDPYLGFPEDIVNYVDSYTPWYWHIQRLLNDPELVKEQGLKLQEYCDQHYNFEKINKVRKQIFESCLTLTSKNLNDLGISIPHDQELQPR